MSNHVHTLYIYIYRERERERESLQKSSHFDIASPLSAGRSLGASFPILYSLVAACQQYQAVVFLQISAFCLQIERRAGKKNCEQEMLSIHHSPQLVLILLSNKNVYLFNINYKSRKLFSTLAEKAFQVIAFANKRLVSKVYSFRHLHFLPLSQEGGKKTRPVRSSLEISIFLNIYLNDIILNHLLELISSLFRRQCNDSSTSDFSKREGGELLLKTSPFPFPHFLSSLGQRH